MNSLRMKIAALASVAGLGGLGGYALSSNTGQTATTQTQAALTQKPKPKVQDAGDPPHGPRQAQAPRPGAAASGPQPALVRLPRLGRGAATAGSRAGPGRGPAAGPPVTSAGGRLAARAAPRAQVRRSRNPSRPTRAAPAAAAARPSMRASDEMRAAVMTDPSPARPTGHGTARRPGGRARARARLGGAGPELQGHGPGRGRRASWSSSSCSPTSFARGTTRPLGSGQVTAQVQTGSAGAGPPARPLVRARWSRATSGASPASPRPRTPDRLATVRRRSRTTRTRDHHPDQRRWARPGPASGHGDDGFEHEGTRLMADPRLRRASSRPARRPTRRPQRRVPGLPTAPGVCRVLPGHVRVPRLPASRRARPGARRRHVASDRGGAAPRPVIVHRRIVVRRVVEVPAAPPPAARASTAGSSSSAASSSSVPASLPRPPLPPPRRRPRRRPAPAPATSHIMSRCDVTFAAMGSEIRLIIEDPRAGAADPAHAAVEAQGFIERFEAKLSRFRPDSELCAHERGPAARRCGRRACSGTRSEPGFTPRS